MQLPGRKLEMNLHKLLARTKQQQQQNTRLLPKLAFNKVRLESLQNKRIWIVWPALKSGNSCSSPRTSLAHFSATAKIRSRLSSLSSQIEICSGCCKNKLLSGVCAQQGHRERERERGARPGNVHDFWQGLALPGIVPASVPVLSCLALPCLGLPSLGEMTLFAIWKYFSLSWPAPGPVPVPVLAPRPASTFASLSCTAYVNRCHSTVLVPPHSFVVYFELVLTYFMAIFLMCPPSRPHTDTTCRPPPVCTELPTYMAILPDKCQTMQYSSKQIVYSKCENTLGDKAETLLIGAT